MNFLKAYIAVCAEFGIYFKVADTVAYAFDASGKRLGYLMQDGKVAGYDVGLHNAGGLLRDVCIDNDVIADFSMPGLFILRNKDRRRGNYAVEANGPGDYALQ